MSPEKLYQSVVQVQASSRVSELQFTSRMQTLQYHNLVHKFIPMPQAMKIPAAEAALDKEWENLEKFSAWNLTKVRSKKEVIDEARTKGATVHFASFNGHMSFEKC